MPELDQLRDDLGYVREVVDRAELRAWPSSIYFLWAAIVLVGWPINDRNPHAAGVFWAIAGPLGGIVSGWLGARWARRVGEASRRLGVQHLLHWSAMLGMIFLLVPLHVAGQLSSDGLSRTIMLAVALAYFLGGVYLSRPLLWIGLLVAGCYVAGFFLHAHLWTISGVVVAASLAAAGALGSREPHVRT